MSRFVNTSLALLAAALICGGIAGPARAGEPRSDVVREADIQTQIDQRIHSEAADRQTVQDLLRRPEVRKIAGTAGLDIRRLEAAAGLLSASELEQVAARANEINGNTGGVETVTLTVTTIIIILLLIIILAN